MLDYQYLPVTAEGAGEKNPSGIWRHDYGQSAALDRQAPRRARRFRVLAEV